MQKNTVGILNKTTFNTYFVKISVQHEEVTCCFSAIKSAVHALVSTQIVLWVQVSLEKSSSREIFKRVIQNIRSELNSL